MQLSWTGVVLGVEQLQSIKIFISKRSLFFFFFSFLKLSSEDAKTTKVSGTCSIAVVFQNESKLICGDSFALVLG